VHVGLDKNSKWTAIFCVRPKLFLKVEICVPACCV
jgi:hypothetical protein